MELITRFILLSLFKIVFPATLKIVSPNISSTTVVPLKTEDQKTSSYQVTENIKDIPDNRTLAPIVPNFGFLLPLNFGNNTIAINNNNVEHNSESSEENEVDINNNTNKDGNLKKNSFSILHIKAEYDDKPVTEHQNVFSKVFGGIKSYVFHLKKGVVDGLHSFFHHHDNPVKEIQNNNHEHDKFHRSFDGEDFDHDYYHDDDEESGEHFDHY